MKRNILVFLMIVSSINILCYSYNFSFFTVFPKLLAGESTYSKIRFISPYSNISVPLKERDIISLVTSNGTYNQLQFEYFDPHNRFLYISEQNGYKVKYSSISINEIQAILISDISPNTSAIGVFSILGGSALGAGSGFIVDMSMLIANGCDGMNEDGSINFGIGTSIGLVAGGLMALNASKHHFKKDVGETVEIPLIGEGKWEIAIDE